MKRPSLNINVPCGEHDQQRLHELLHAQCWRAALDWTKMYIEAHNSTAVEGNADVRQTPLLSPQILEVWFVLVNSNVSSFQRVFEMPGFAPGPYFLAAYPIRKKFITMNLGEYIRIRDFI